MMSEEDIGKLAAQAQQASFDMLFRMSDMMSLIWKRENLNKISF